MEENQKCDGTLGLRDVEVGKSYMVMNGGWAFKVLAKSEEDVQIKYPLGASTLNIADTEDESKHPLWVVELE